MTLSSFWRVAGAVLLCAGATPIALAQQSAPAPAPANVSPLPAAQHPGTRTMTKRDAPGASKPAGFNPRFSPDGERFVQQGGEQLYRSVCQGCHMPQGQGAQGAGFYPPLARNARLAAGPYPVYVVLNGLHGMPPFDHRLDDQQVADVVNYIRTHFGNAYQDAISAQEVKKLRP